MELLRFLMVILSAFKASQANGNGLFWFIVLSSITGNR